MTRIGRGSTRLGHPMAPVLGAYCLALAAPELVLSISSRTSSAGGRGSGWTTLVWPLVQIALMFFVVATLVAYLVYVERKISAFIQARLGPMRVGPWGLLQPLADLVKLLDEGRLHPGQGGSDVFPLAPMISVLAGLHGLLGASRSARRGSIISDVNIGLLFVFAFSSLGVLGIIMAGWSSNSKYPLLGGLRSSAQMVSYEVGDGAGDRRRADLHRDALDGRDHQRQASSPGSGTSSTSRSASLSFWSAGWRRRTARRSTCPRANQRSSAGFHTEYSGFRWSLFFLSEYTAMLVVAAVATTLYLGGWHLPGAGANRRPAASPNLYAIVGLLRLRGEDGGHALCLHVVPLDVPALPLRPA